MADLTLDGTPVLDDYSETFEAQMVRVLFTSLSREWAREAAVETKGIGRSATMPPCEATLEGEVAESDTPDGRPGFVVQMMDRKAKHLRECLALRLRKGGVPQPQLAVFDWLPEDLREDAIDLDGTVIPKFGDGHTREVEHCGRTMYQIPRMDGRLLVERRFGVRTACTGGMFLILGSSVSAALTAAEASLRACETVPRIVSKVAASGSKVGSEAFEDMVATTNHAYCPDLKDLPDNHLPADCECVYEVIVSGPTEADVRAGMRAGLKAAAGREGVIALHTANYGGKLGSGKIPLSEVI